MVDSFKSAFETLEKKFGDDGLTKKEFEQALDQLPDDFFQELKHSFDLIDTDGTGKILWDDVFVYISHSATSDHELGIVKGYREPPESLVFPRNIDTKRSYYCPGLGLVSSLRSESSSNGYQGTVIMESGTWTAQAYVTEKTVRSAAYSQRHRVLGICDEDDIRLSFYSTSRVTPLDLFESMRERPFAQAAARQKRSILEGGQNHEYLKTYPFLGTITTELRHLHIVAGVGRLSDAFITGDRSGRIYIWDVTKIDALRSTPFGESMTSDFVKRAILLEKRVHTQLVSCLLSTSDHIVSASLGGHIVVLDPSTTNIIQNIASGSSQDSVSSIGWSEKHKLLLSGGGSGEISVWPYGSQQSDRLVLRDCKRPHFRNIIGIETVKGNHHYVVTGDSVGLIKVWDLRKLQCVQSLHQPINNSAAHSRDAKQQLCNITVLPQKGGILALGNHSWLYEPYAVKSSESAVPDAVVGICVQLCTLSLWTWTVHVVHRWSLLDTIMTSQYHYRDLHILKVFAPSKETPRWLIVSHRSGILLVSRDHGQRLASFEMSPPVLISLRKVNDERYSLLCFSGSREREPQIVTLVYRNEKHPPQAESTPAASKPEPPSDYLDLLLADTGDDLSNKMLFQENGPVLTCTAVKPVTGVGGFVSWLPVGNAPSSYLDATTKYENGLAVFSTGYQVVSSRSAITTVGTLPDFWVQPESRGPLSFPIRKSNKSERKPSTVEQNKVIETAKELGNLRQIVACTELTETGVVAVADSFGALTIWLLNPPFRKVCCLEELPSGHQATTLEYYVADLRLYVGDDFGAITSYGMVEIFSESSSIGAIPINAMTSVLCWHSLPVQQLTVEASPLLISIAGSEIFIWSTSLIRMTILSAQRIDVAPGFQCPFVIEDSIHDGSESEYLAVSVPQRGKKIKTGYLRLPENNIADENLQELVFSDSDRERKDVGRFRSLSYFWDQSKELQSLDQESVNVDVVVPPSWAVPTSSFPTSTTFDSGWCSNPERDSTATSPRDSILERSGSQTETTIKSALKKTTFAAVSEKDIITKEDSDQSSDEKQDDRTLKVTPSWTIRKTDCRFIDDSDVDDSVHEKSSADSFSEPRPSSSESDMDSTVDFTLDIEMTPEIICTPVISSLQQTFLFTPEEGYVTIRRFLTNVSGVLFPPWCVKLSLIILQFSFQDVPSIPPQFTSRHVLWKPPPTMRLVSSVYAFGTLKRKIGSPMAIAILNTVDTSCLPRPVVKLSQREIWLIFRKHFTMAEGFQILRFYGDPEVSDYPSYCPHKRLRERNPLVTTKSDIRLLSDLSNRFERAETGSFKLAPLSEVEFIESFRLASPKVQSLIAKKHPFLNPVLEADDDAQNLCKPNSEKKKVRLNSTVKLSEFQKDECASQDTAPPPVVRQPQKRQSSVIEQNQILSLKSRQSRSYSGDECFSDIDLCNRRSSRSASQTERSSSRTKSIFADVNFNHILKKSVRFGNVGNDDDDDINNDSEVDSRRSSSRSKSRSCSNRSVSFSRSDEFMFPFGRRSTSMVRSRSSAFNSSLIPFSLRTKKKNVRFGNRSLAFHERKSHAELISRKKYLLKIWISVRSICDVSDSCCVFGYLTGESMLIERAGRSPKRRRAKGSSNSSAERPVRPWWWLNKHVSSGSDTRPVAVDDANDPRKRNESPKEVCHQTQSEVLTPTPPRSSPIKKRHRPKQPPNKRNNNTKMILRPNQPGWIAMPNSASSLVSIPHLVRSAPRRQWDELLKCSNVLES